MKTIFLRILAAILLLTAAGSLSAKEPFPALSDNNDFTSSFVSMLATRNSPQSVKSLLNKISAFDVHGLESVYTYYTKTPSGIESGIAEVKKFLKKHGDAELIMRQKEAGKKYASETYLVPWDSNRKLVLMTSFGDKDMSIYAAVELRPEVQRAREEEAAARKELHKKQREEQRKKQPKPDNFRMPEMPAKK